ncbi:probable tRNA (uracil-O(2)-)-methyltransferase [Clytia hemisphaerica]|uniref:probable tRNA (uracil-O(2)-)-methyltransferase n=1 Tax=Clytia hemisphaerica TaxID=252671 RepID=UPI0034D68B5C
MKENKQNKEMFEKIFSTDEFHKRICGFDFEEAFDIWNQKPQVANRRLAGALKITENIDIIYDSDNVDDCVTCIKGILSNIEEDGFKQWYLENDDNIRNMLSPMMEYFCFHKIYRTETNTITLFVRKLLPRSIERYKNTYEMVLWKSDHSISAIMYIPLCIGETNETCLSSRSYVFVMVEADRRIDVLTHQNFTTTDVPTHCLVTSQEWLHTVLIKKITAWMEAASLSDHGLRKQQTLSQINIESYMQTYNRLKKKYGPYFVENWTESTDAQKFVYEDIALASYLIVLWSKEREERDLLKMQSFIDLGCGNGLLVHILSSEGHPGRGVDLARRKIWNMYGENTKLEVETILPDTTTVTEDWIIGNHSDELTPWIPVIASRSSFDTRYFVLPCCFHDFYNKFHHKDQKKSHYESYLEHILQIGRECLFEVAQDMLRIPSTKREGVNLRIEKLLTQNSRQSVAMFNPRSTQNIVKNCTQIDNSIKDLVIKTVSNLLLFSPEDSTVVERTEIDFVIDLEQKTSKGCPWSDWNRGGRIHLNDIAQHFDGEILKEMKCQCGGLQTLLKNNGNIFKVVGGYVSIRDQRNPKDKKPVKKKVVNKQGEERRKTKMCWFHLNHPQGCLFSSDICNYAHQKDELRTI